jgi:hypothetical protein
MPPADVHASTPTDSLTLEQRLKFVESLGELGPGEALPGLRRAARDPDPRVRQQAAEVAAALPSNGAGPLGAPVLRLLLEDPDMAVRARAAALLSHLLRPPTSEPAAPAKALPAPAAKEPVPPPEKSALSPAPVPDETVPAPPRPMAELSVKELTTTGVRSLSAKDFGKAEELLGKAQRLCAPKTKPPTPGCSELSFDLSYQLGRAHEGQRHLAQAMTEYENAIKLASQKRGKPALLGEAQEAVLRLVPRLGVVVVPKKIQKSCREVPIWMEPGQHEIQVDGKREVVEVRAHETRKVGSCPAP